MRPKESERNTGIVGKGELVRRLREREGITWKQANRIIEDLFEDISDTLVKGTSVFVPQFGKFHVVDGSNKRVRHPATGEMIEVEIGKSIRFRQADNIRRKFKEQEKN